MVEIHQFSGPPSALHSRVKLGDELDDPGFKSRQRQYSLQKRPDFFLGPTSFTADPPWTGFVSILVLRALSALYALS